MPEQSIDRSAKADRAPVFSEPVAPSQTISIHVDRVPDTSVLVRIPVARDDQGGKDQGSAAGSANQGGASQGSAPEGNAAPAAQQMKDQRKATVACEPVVSVLTDIAKHLQPGRCIT